MGAISSELPGPVRGVGDEGAPSAEHPGRARGVDDASARITEEVTSWPDVEAGFGRRGEWAFRTRGREIGHLHGDHAAHFFFPKDLWRELRGEGRIVEHPVFPDREGPAARPIVDEDDVREVVELLRLNYDHVRTRAGAR